jgi:hypothetical protein
MMSILAYLAGQSITLRISHKILIILMQIFIFMSIILSNLYQGELVSFMTEPKTEYRIQTFDELSNSNYKFVADEYFKNYLKITGAYSGIAANIIDTNYFLNISCEDAVREKIVIINPCEDFDFYHYDIAYSKEHRALYYVMSERILSYYRIFLSTICNPFLERWQKFMDLSIAAGLPQYWDLIFTFKFVARNAIDKNVEEDLYLHLENMSQAFYLLLIGLSLSFLVFIAEIFYHRYHLRNIIVV